tara:strand:- start:5289 stop:5612 length:324 start_codon:yes stop_codon:yes gene_type:complete
MEHTKEELKKLSLFEIKLICKRYNLKRTGTKSILINSILSYLKPNPVVINIPTEYKLPKDKKIIGLKLDEPNKRTQLGKLREKQIIKELYYSMGVNYYLVDKDFEFI